MEWSSEVRISRAEVNLSNFVDQIRGADTRVCRSETRLGAFKTQQLDIIIYPDDNG